VEKGRRLVLKIVLTGGIATGKSHVFDRLVQSGIPGLDADAIAHGVMTSGTEATAAIAARFGPEVLAPDGAVNRAALGPIVFADAAARRDLEAIVHPAVHRSIVAGLRAFELLGHTHVVVAVPLFFETGRADNYDRVVVTACSPAQQIERLLARGLTEQAARQRLAAQLPTDQKVAKADFVVHTDGSFEETDRQIAALLKAIQTNVWPKGRG
jgi:dephospho-CoA kinase